MFKLAVMSLINHVASTIKCILESPCCSATCHGVGGETRVGGAENDDAEMCCASPSLSSLGVGGERLLAVMRYLLGGGGTVSAGGGHDAGGFDEPRPALLSMGPILKMDSNMMMMMMRKLLKPKRCYWLLVSDSNQSEPRQGEISPNLLGDVWTTQDRYHNYTITVFDSRRLSAGDCSFGCGGECRCKTPPAGQTGQLEVFAQPHARMALFYCGIIAVFKCECLMGGCGIVWKKHCVDKSRKNDIFCDDSVFVCKQKTVFERM